MTNIKREVTERRREVTEGKLEAGKSAQKREVVGRNGRVGIYVIIKERVISHKLSRFFIWACHHFDDQRQNIRKKKSRASKFWFVIFVFFAYACFTDFHTGETNEINIKTSTREKKMRHFLVLISQMFTLGFSSAWACVYVYFTSVNQVQVLCNEYEEMESIKLSLYYWQRHASCKD